MKPIIICGSSRKTGHSALIAEKINSRLNGEIIHLSDYNIGYFDYENGNKDDDFNRLIHKLSEFRVWILLTPVYWYSMSARMKTFIDRLSDLLKWEKHLAEALKGGKWYAISCGSDDDEVDGYFEPFRRSAEYLDIQYLGNMHVWKDNRLVITPEVERRLEDVINTLELQP